MMDQATARRMWYCLHRFARREKARVNQVAFVEKWLSDVEAKLGCTSCFWKVKRFCDLWPVAYGEELWLWSICLHDYVNKELGRSLFHPDITLAPLMAKGIIH